MSPDTASSPYTPARATALAERLAATFGELLMGGPADAADDVAPLTVMPAAQATAPQQLAAAHPGGLAARKEALALYRRCLAHYRQRMQAGQPEDDVGAAAAYFVLACVAALQQIDVSPAQLALVERQMRRLLGQHPAWRQADAAERQALFEQFAVLGVLVGESQHEARRQGPAARANVQRAARGYLRQLLGLQPDHLQLGDHGLVLRLPVQPLADALKDAGAA
ncbi:DUF6683 family protein [Aquincola sp. J276]|uniref:DUF6683 family protein n=1 Tax=Aquincola sp. J276 TaxID=2898432 RepID=UPI002150A236|nr:DUF6683 family protein [Aquincola sp. J276]MCR5867126.1 hypothetical protein [Aquincola sp. J276]